MTVHNCASFCCDCNERVGVWLWLSPSNLGRGKQARNKRLRTTGERGVIQPPRPLDKPFMEEVLLKMSRKREQNPVMLTAFDSLTRYR